jgi:hypothetical protein
VTTAIERAGEILALRRVELEARIRAACCPISGLPGSSRITLERHIELICRAVEKGKYKGEATAADLGVTGSALVQCDRPAERGTQRGQSRTRAAASPPTSNGRSSR